MTPSTQYAVILGRSIVVLFSFALILPSSPAWGQVTPADYFRQNCKVCHTIGGGRLQGPDLKDVSKRQKREWLVNFLMDPPAVIDRGIASGDPYAKSILDESKGFYMQPIAGMTPQLAEKLLDLIEAESQLPESQFKGVQISTEPFTDENRKLGRKYFLGKERFQAGGTSCISCHSMQDLEALGGGRLGPDLTNVYERLEGRKALSNWLTEGTGGETMQPVFRNHSLTKDEIHALVAYFESTAAERPAEPAVSRVAFLLMGLIGAAAWVFLFDVLWKRRFHAVRRPLVESLPARGES